MGASNPKSRGVAGWALLVLALLVASWFGLPEGGPAPGAPEPPQVAAPSPAPVAPAEVAAPAPAPRAAPATVPVPVPAEPVIDPESQLPVVEVGELPREARLTLARIDGGGPFPYERDGTEFQNREGLLPDRPRGSYREYTVPTPGAPDRGPRRIVTGPEAGYYTEDHYASFRRIRGWP